MVNLVKLLKNSPVVSTFDLFAKMGYREHRKLKEVINSQIDAFNDLGILPLEKTKPTKKTGGRPIEAYLLNEDHFILLVLLAKNSPESVALKIRVSKEFKRQKNVIAALVRQQNDASWQNIRKDGKIAYKQKTDVIKDFVEYADSQGSNSPDRYYCSLSKMENAALFIIEEKYPNLRDILNIKQLMQVCTADDVVEKALKEGMESNLHYKDIFKLAKKRVCAFAEIIGQSPVHSLCID